MAARIKGLKEKTSSGYSNLIPFGTDGNFVDMLSGMNLEEELLIGKEHYVTITNNPNSDVTTIIDTYAKKTTTSNFYQVRTTIRENSSTNVIEIRQELWFIINPNDDNANTMIKTKTTTIAEEDVSTKITEVFDA